MSCWGCSGHLLVMPGLAAGLRRAGAGTYCKRCQRIIAAEEAARPCVPGARCVHVQYQSGPFSQLVIEKAEYDRVTVFVLGFPEDFAELARVFWPPCMQGRRVFARGELLMKGT